MTSTDTLSIYIKKLSHPVKEIRERALHLLLAKFRLGWELEDELASTRNLLEALLAWFRTQDPSMQQEALKLLVITIKTKSGTYISKELGINAILENLDKIKCKIHEDALETFDDLVDTLLFLNTVDSQSNMAVPPLKINSETSSNTIGSSNCYYNLINGSKVSSEPTSIVKLREENVNDIVTQDGIVILLYPWVCLNSSDLKTVTLIRDSLKILKSTRRCCRFIQYVFLRDFPAEMFLNRPAIIKILLAISDRQCGGHPVEALNALLYITQALCSRFYSLFSMDLASQSHELSDDFKDCEDNINMQLEKFVSLSSLSLQDSLVPLPQLPAPLFVLETAQIIITIMTRNVILVDMNDENDVYDMNELNVCLCLVENLVKLLLQCVTEHFWSIDHTNKTHRDISHKSCVLMRMLGELVMKYRTSFTQDPKRMHYRVAWLRLVVCAEKLLNWAKDSSLPPTSLIAALQAALIDPALTIIYPDISEKISFVLFNAKSSVDKEYKSRYKELNKLFESMDHEKQFIKIKDTSCNPAVLLNCIKKALPSLHINLNETFLGDVGMVLLKKLKDFHMNDADWSIARSIVLSLMAHNLSWVKESFYKMLAKMVKITLLGDDINQTENEKCLTLICDVGILSEICCHGLSATLKEVQNNASEIMLYLLRGRMILSDSVWWRLLASLLPVLPLLHVYAAHDTDLGKAICKSLETDIVKCMGVSKGERIAGLTRLMFVNCAPVRLDATHSICRLLDDSKYLPPREVLRADVIMNALRRIKPQDFNVDQASSPSKNPQTSGLIQTIEVLKQDLIIDEETLEYKGQSISRPALEPSLRRSTLQQLALMIRQQELHDTFIQNDGVNLIISLLRLSLMVDDYLAFPECAISCVSVLNSACFKCRHSLVKIPDLPLLLIRVILIFPANDDCVLMSAQILALIAWAGFALQELDSSRRKVPALPANVTQNTSLPFVANSYWATSPNCEHSSVEWLLAEDMWRTAIRVRWSWIQSGGRLASPASSLQSSSLVLLRAANLRHSCTNLLLALENATSHSQVYDALNLLECYVHLIKYLPSSSRELEGLPWHLMKRFLAAPPASLHDTTLLVSLLQFIIVFMDNASEDDNTITWVLSSFIGNDAVIISLLSKDRLYPQQTANDIVEVTQLRIYIVKIVFRCVRHMEYRRDYSSRKVESLLKILLTCLERIDLKNFHMLGYLNEVIHCVRYAVYSQYCQLSEDTLLESLRVMTYVLSGCASGAGRKGQACRLDTMLTLLALLQYIQEQSIPVQRWSELWSGKVMDAVGRCVTSQLAELRAAALSTVAALAHYTQLIPHLLQSVGVESLSKLALENFSRAGEANVVRAAAASLLTIATARTSPQTQAVEVDVLQALADGEFIEECLNIFVEFCKDREYKTYIEPNVPLSMLERGEELEVRAQKSGEFNLAPSLPFQKPPPTSSLIASLADVVHNLTTYKNAPVQQWNEAGLYRVLFKCIFWCQGSDSEVYNVRNSISRALATASNKKCVRTSLAGTKDCLYNLLLTLTPLEDEENEAECVQARAQSLNLLAALLPERAASDVVWSELKKNHLLFHLLLQALQSEYGELQDASMYCITQLARSLSSKNKKCVETSNRESLMNFLDNLPSPYSQSDKNILGAGDSAREDCQPEYIVEDCCKILINIYLKCSDNILARSCQDDKWTLVCTCICSLLTCSARARHYCVHRRFPRVLLRHLHALRDSMSLHAKPVEVIRNADHEPSLNTLYWILTLITCQMFECAPAKEHIAEDVAPSLTRLWPWCMMNERLRDALLNLLVTFTNDCPRAWASMCNCTGGRSLLNEACALATREASRARPAPTLALALRALTHCVPHHHCRNIIIKNDVLSCMIKLRARGSYSEGTWTAVGAQWARLCAAAAARVDGAAAVLALAASPAFRPLPAALLPAFANAAHYQRLTFLQSPDLLEFLSGCLLTGTTKEVVSATRAVWALAANNHRAKLVFRSAGIVSAVQSARQRLQRSQDEAAQRAVELLTYTNTVLLAT